MAVAMYQAVRLARRNKRRHEKLTARRRKLDRHTAQETAAQEERRRATYERALVPFQEVFARIERVDLAELAPADPPGHAPADPPGHAPADVGPREVRHLAASLIGSLVGGGATGAGLGTATYLAVGAFATASTGTAISGLSGAAASSATLAWLGGGSLAAGGGGMAAGTAVLAAVVAVPALVVGGALLEWRGRSVRGDQERSAERLAEAEAELTEARRTLSEVFQRSREIRLVLLDLCLAMEERLPAFTALVAAHDDYGTYDAARRAQVKEIFDLACTTVMVLGTPPAGEDGRAGELSARVLAEARAHLATLTPAT
ncbi:hypothetical protein [Streptomyces sp. AD55]|uniref:hypothetical protein n=1 Tax=Streptomyces sp. AD55 TaxID=3242895 RepID=UPI0035289323